MKRWEPNNVTVNNNSTHEEIVAKITRNTVDIDHAHDRFRALQTEVDVVKTRLATIETKLITVESKSITLEERVLEDRELLKELKHEVFLLKKTSDSMFEMVKNTMKSSELTYSALQKHIIDENNQFTQQTGRIESMSRRLVIFIAALTSFVVVLIAIYQHLSGADAIETIFKIFRALMSMISTGSSSGT